MLQSLITLSTLNRGFIFSASIALLLHFFKSIADYLIAAVFIDLQ
jgi:hypothetical protein